MIVVLYTEDLEPIIPIDLPLWLLDRLEQEGAVRVAVSKPMGFKGQRIPINIKISLKNGLNFLLNKSISIFITVATSCLSSIE